MSAGYRTLSSASDAELLLTLKETVRRADWKGRNSVITELYHRYARNLAATWLRRTGDPELTQDLLQETFARATARLNSLPQDRSVLIWLRTTARNYFLDRRRREATARAAADGHVERSGRRDAERVFVSRVDRGRAQTFVARYLRELGPQAREVVRLRLEGCELGEVCERLGVSEREGRRLYARVRFVLQKMRMRGVPLFSSDLLIPMEVEGENERVFF